MTSTQNPNALTRAVLATVAALDASQYPPTGREVWRWLFAVDPRTAGVGTGASFGLGGPVSIEQVEAELGRLIAANRIGTESGRYHRSGSEGLIELHEERRLRGKKKWNRARRAVEFLRLVPYVEMIAVCNTLSIDNAKPESDIDVFIVLSDGHLWTGRALVTAVVHALGLRRHGSAITDRICLSFFVSESAMDLSPLAHPIDPHLALWTAQMVPVFDRNKTFERFRAANAWIQTILPNAFTEDRTDHRVTSKGPARVAQGYYEQFLTLTLLAPVIESFARRQQRKRMDKNWWSRAKEGGTDVVISDAMLKFHESDRRGMYRDAISERVQRVLGPS